MTQKDFILLSRRFLMLIIFTAFILLLNGCSSFRIFKGETFPGYDTDKYKVVCGDLSSKICISREFARSRALEYRNEFLALENQNAWVFDYPLIGVASATAGSLLYGANADLIKGLGLAAATIAGVKSYGNNKGKAGFFLLAEEAARCVVDQSSIFIETNATNDTKKVIENAIQSIQNVLKDATPILGSLADGTKEKEALSSAIDSALKAIKIGALAARSIEDAPGKVLDSIYKIDTKLYGLIRNSVPDVKDIIATINATATTSASASSAREIIEVNSRRISELTAGRYTGQRDEVEQLTPQEKAIKYAIQLTDASKTIGELAPAYVEALAGIDRCLAKL